MASFGLKPPQNNYSLPASSYEQYIPVYHSKSKTQSLITDHPEKSHTPARSPLAELSKGHGPLRVQGSYVGIVPRIPPCIINEIIQPSRTPPAFGVSCDDDSTGTSQEYEAAEVEQPPNMTVHSPGSVSDQNVGKDKGDPIWSRLAFSEPVKDPVSQINPLGRWSSDKEYYYNVALKLGLKHLSEKQKFLIQLGLNPKIHKEHITLNKNGSYSILIKGLTKDTCAQLAKQYFTPLASDL